MVGIFLQLISTSSVDYLLQEDRVLQLQGKREVKAYSAFSTCSVITTNMSRVITITSRFLLELYWNHHIANLGITNADQCDGSNQI